MVNGYFKVYVPAKMTAPDDIKDLTAVTQEAANLLVRAQRSNNQAVIQRITLLLLESMKGVAEGNYHPAASMRFCFLADWIANPQIRPPRLHLYHLSRPSLFCCRCTKTRIMSMESEQRRCTESIVMFVSAFPGLMRRAAAQSHKK